MKKWICALMFVFVMVFSFANVSAEIETQQCEMSDCHCKYPTVKTTEFRCYLTTSQYDTALKFAEDNDLGSEKVMQAAQSVCQNRLNNKVASDQSFLDKYGLIATCEKRSVSPAKKESSNSDYHRRKQPGSAMEPPI